MADLIAAKARLQALIDEFEMLYRQPDPRLHAVGMALCFLQHAADVLGEPDVAAD